MTLSFQKVSKGHDRKGFDCGNGPLNSFLQSTANQNENRNITRTKVLVDTDKPTEIFGFYTLSFCEIHAPTASELYKKYPHPLSGLRLARMAVDLKHAGKGYGGLMLIDAIRNACKSNEVGPLLGMFVDAKDPGVKSFYQHYGFLQVDDNALSLWLPIKACQVVAAASE